MGNELLRKLDMANDHSGAMDVIQILNAAKNETDPVRLGRLEKRVNVALVRLSAEEHGWILEQLGESATAVKMAWVNGHISGWCLT